MSSTLPQVWTVLGTIWTTYFTGWRIPLINITPAVMIFGILSFKIAIKLIFGILNITSQNISSSEKLKGNHE